MKLTKKTIISNTILFAGIIGFVMLFGKLFGNENILIGVSTITAMLMLLERDMTSHPVRNTLKFVALNVFMGLAAFLAGFNPFLAIPINFITMFVISYSLLFNLKNPLYFPFSLQYIFILAMPVAVDQMPMRIASLVFGALAIMGIQLLANKNKMRKSGDKKIQAICDGLIVKAQNRLEGTATDEIDEQISTDISGLRGIIYDKREENYYLTEEGRLKLNVSASFEKINILLDTMDMDESRNPLLTSLVDCLTAASDSLTDKEAVQTLDYSFKQMLSKYESEQTHSETVFRMLNALDFLKDSLSELSSLGKGQSNVVRNLEHIPKKFQKLRISEKKSHTNSIKISYAVRMAVAISLTGFIADYFELTEGRWMLFTVLSVIIPIYEQSQKKMRDRIFATVVGAILVAIAFAIFQGTMIRTVLLMTAGYLMSYVKVYRYSTILVTFSAIGSAALITGTTEILTVERLLLVVLGIVIALLINKFILPYKLEDANEDLKDMYEDTIHEMLLEVAQQVKGTGHDHVMKNLLLFTTMIEDRLKLNNQANSTDKELAWLQHQRRAASTIYELYWWIHKHGVDESNIVTITAELDLLIGTPSAKQLLHEALPGMKDRLQTMERIEDLIVQTMIVEITEDVHASKQLYTS